MSFPVIISLISIILHYDISFVVSLPLVPRGPVQLASLTFGAG